jgi:hypothetical protein
VDLLMRGVRLLAQGQQVLDGGADDGAEPGLLFRRRVDLDGDVPDHAVGMRFDPCRIDRGAHEPAAMAPSAGTGAEPMADGLADEGTGQPRCKHDDQHEQQAAPPAGSRIGLGRWIGHGGLLIGIGDAVLPLSTIWEHFVSRASLQCKVT